MSRLIQQAHRAENHNHNLEFRSIADPGGGYAFPCDERGIILKQGMGEAAWHSLGAALEGVGQKYLPATVERYTNRYWEPAIVQCDCGAKVEVHVTSGEYNYAGCEKCDRHYNMSGQLLNHPNTWDEEEL